MACPEEKVCPFLKGIDTAITLAVYAFIFFSKQAFRSDKAQAEICLLSGVCFTNQIFFQCFEKEGKTRKHGSLYIFVKWRYILRRDSDMQRLGVKFM